MHARASEAFSSMGGFITERYELSGGGFPEEVPAARLGAGVWPTLGTRPILGRFFTQEEEDGRQPVAVASYALWLNRYHRDPHILGASIVLDRKVYSIVGVMPRNFEFPLEAGHLDQPRPWLP
jgi:putative ABC transport system permease protein